MTLRELAELREQRAQVYDKMQAIVDECDGSLSRNQAEAYDRLEAKFDRLDEQVRAAHEHGDEPSRRSDSDDRRERFRSIDCSGQSNPGEFRRERRATDRGVFLGERRFADAFDVTQPERREADEFSLGALLQGLAGTRQLATDSPEHRTLIGSGATGALVPSAVASGILDGVFAASVCHAAGAQAVPMTARTLTLPRIDTPPSPAWHAEGQADVPEDEPGIGAAVLTANTVAVRFSAAVELLEDASAQSADGLATAMVQAIASAIDEAALIGDGSGNGPTGLFYDADVAHTVLGDPDGAPLDGYRDLVRAIFAVRGRNLAPDAAIYSERSAEEYANLTASDGQPLRAPRIVDELPQLSTTAVPDDLTTGANSDSSALFVGRFADLAIGYLPSIGVKVEQSQVKGDSLTREFVAYCRADVAVLRPAAFEVVEGVRPAAAA
ncbi:MAG TPA: phage major capsid protein [Baekduia sp.]|nr:phage major capsid protein [Baekduia sp.]